MTRTRLLRQKRKVFGNRNGTSISIGITIIIVVVIVGDAICICGASVGGSRWEIRFICVGVLLILLELLELLLLDESNFSDRQAQILHINRFSPCHFSDCFPSVECLLLLFPAVMKKIFINHINREKQVRLPIYYQDELRKIKFIGQYCFIFALLIYLIFLCFQSLLARCIITF